MTRLGAGAREGMRETGICVLFFRGGSPFACLQKVMWALLPATFSHPAAPAPPPTTAQPLDCGDLSPLSSPADLSALPVRRED